MNKDRIIRFLMTPLIFVISFVNGITSKMVAFAVAKGVTRLFRKKKGKKLDYTSTKNKERLS